MSDDEIRGRAELLLGDLEALQPGRSFVPSPTMPTREAYDLQEAVVRLRECRGERVIGYKIGCISPVIQAQLGADRPIFGRMFDTGCFPSGSRLSHSRFADLAIEGELAIRLARDVAGLTLSDEDAIAAIGSVFPVIELHHYGWRSAGGSLPTLIATSGMHAGLVPSTQETSISDRVPSVQGLGSTDKTDETGSSRFCQPARGMPPGSRAGVSSVLSVSLSIHINDRLVGSTTEPWAMGSPTAALFWLCNSLDSVGERLMRDQVILTGSVLPLFPVRPGDRVVVEARLLGQCVVQIDA
jgi:2-keto-4-pentenoate hydratase